jgi:hypothetical protein
LRFSPPYGFSSSGPYTKGVHVMNSPVNTIALVLGDLEERGDDLFARAFLSFDLSGLPADAKLRSARLHVSLVRCYNDPFEHLGRMIVEPLVFDSVEIPLVTAAPVLPVDGPAFAVVEPGTPTPGLKTADVTAFVADALRNRGKRRGRFQVRVGFERDLHKDEVSNYCGLVAGSAVADPARSPPRLEVEFD